MRRRRNKARRPAEDGVLDAGAAFIGKPFTGDELAVKLREVLDAPGKTTSHRVKA